jgi:hypothetical protein
MIIILIIEAEEPVIHELIGKSMLRVLNGSATVVHPDDGMGWGPIPDIKKQLFEEWNNLQNTIMLMITNDISANYKSGIIKVS